MKGVNCLTWALFADTIILGMWIVWGLANPKPNRFDDGPDEGDYTAMIDDLEHGDE